LRKLRPIVGKQVPFREKTWNQSKDTVYHPHQQAYFAGNTLKEDWAWWRENVFDSQNNLTEE